MASVFPVIIMLAVALGLMAVSFIFVRKGPNQTVTRSSLMLTIAVCYLTWAITYMAQLHPLIAPVRKAEA
ncbi:ATPase, V0 complex, subunit E1/e2 [Coprinopsis sp. MPI-PUGE-AT-0042]|nr:ATPase, V0 complex, subunit E1/e2 [Coprinopsis sp. MPI-PUGE-AT-0042]